MTPIRWIASLSVSVAGLVFPLIPARLALRDSRPIRVDGAETLDDALAICRHTGLRDWDLVAFAQQLVYRKFIYYSCRNLWDTPSQAFRRGMGYCTQYNLALKQLLDRLGFDTQAVFSLRVSVLDRPDWTMGHTWLKVGIDDDVRDVCAGHAGNLPGQVNFRALAPVWPGHAPALVLSHVGMIVFCGYLEWRAVFTHRPLPIWMFQKR